MITAIYTGSFDPITLGHLIMIKRASRVFDKLIVCIMVNKDKKPLFTQEERLRQVRLVTQRFPNVEVDQSDLLVADYARLKGAKVIVRGLRAVSDYEKECQMALMNKRLYPELVGLEEQGAQAFLLACTELPLVFHDGGRVPFIDPTLLLARTAVEAAGGKVKE